MNNVWLDNGSNSIYSFILSSKSGFWINREFFIYWHIFLLFVQILTQRKPSRPGTLLLLPNQSRRSFLLNQSKALTFESCQNSTKFSKCRKNQFVNFWPWNGPYVRNGPWRFIFTFFSFTCVFFWYSDSQVKIDERIKIFTDFEKKIGIRILKEEKGKFSWIYFIDKQQLQYITSIRPFRP